VPYDAGKRGAGAVDSAQLRYVDLAAAERLLQALAERRAEFSLREHEPPRHARHLAALWQVPLHEAGRATLLVADGEPLLAVVPADRKIGAPRLRSLLGATDLRVLRGDRGVGRIGWEGLPAPAGALPAVPAIFGARGLLDELALRSPRLVIALDGTRSIALAPAEYLRAAGVAPARFAGTTRLLPGGGMVEDDPYGAAGATP
jgi:prolyl-tRNA editing enzyme YbaK/EbsC (Cys-tRNA(Pro) deacylase)